MAAEDANLRNWRFGTFGDLAARVRNYASRGRESANYGGAILLGLTALEWEEGAQHPAQWRFVTLYNIVSQTGCSHSNNSSLQMASFTCVANLQ